MSAAGGEPSAEGRRDPASDAERQMHVTQEWLVAELRDECSDIGVSARGFDLEGFVRGVQAFAQEARRLGAPAERMLILLKQCLADERLPLDDRERYLHYHTTAMTTAINSYYARPDPPEPPGRPLRAD